MSMGPEVKEINWKQARGAVYRWPQVMRKPLICAMSFEIHADSTLQLCS